MEQDKDIRLNSIVDNLIVLYIDGALVLAQTLEQQAKTLHLDKDLTPEQKKEVKSELNFSSNAIKYLGEARRGFQRFINSCDKLSDEMQTRIASGMDNREMSAVNSLLALNILMMDKIFRKTANEDEIDKFLWDLDGLPDEDVRKVHNALMRKAEKFSSYDKG